ncbi:zona pellucida sperm-binding protein 4-like [Clarias gariepinus]|uniref:zona pellucida sperm-binding protein 4-like n=1 Tax=Clarias gariepinus TaxID=13013 RepID=UPI00234C5260|nr:zona pellucida sperm-binding protein 4-like [Clarias gariepinus]
MATKTVKILMLCCIELFIVKAFKEDSFMTDFFDSMYQNNEKLNEDVYVQSVDPIQEAPLRQHQNYSFFCDKDAVKVVLLSSPVSVVKVLALSGLSIPDQALETAKECVYSVTKERKLYVLWISFSGCHVTAEEGRFTLQVLYRNNVGSAEVVKVSCDASSDMALQKVRVPRSNGEEDCLQALGPGITTHQKLPQIYTKPGCDIPINQRLPCGPPETTAAECINNGCCMDKTNSSCYYPMDQCTPDGHFVFTVHFNVTTIPVSATSLHVASVDPCKPILVTDDFATFKFSVSECGTKSYNIGDTTVYMAEVRTAVRAHKLKYSVITRDHPVKLMVECRYSKISPAMMRATAGYMVMSPSMPASVRSGGLYGVQLRIADDETFSSFFAHGHLPLKVLLGKPLYLEVRLNSPKPEATLVVNYCVAYTQSARNALVLLYEGCPNPDLYSAQSSFLHVLDLPQTPHQRRFMVAAFQFMNVTTQKHINEEIYFMCSTEVCMPSDIPCPKTCFDGKA